MPLVMSIPRPPPPKSGKIGIAPASHTPYNLSDLPLRDQPDSSSNAASRACRILGVSIVRQTLNPKMSFTWSIVDMSYERIGQLIRTTLF